MYFYSIVSLRSLDSIIEDLHTGRDFYNSETLRELLKLLPEAEEVRIRLSAIENHLETSIGSEWNSIGRDRHVSVFLCDTSAL